MIIKRLLERKYLWGAIFWTITITFLSLVSLNKISTLPEIKFKDKIIHFMFYFVFVILWAKGLSLKKINLLWLFLIAVFYGIIIEIFQSLFTVSRQADVFDALANTIGAFTGLFILAKK